MGQRTSGTLRDYYNQEIAIAATALLSIAIHLILRFRLTSAEMFHGIPVDLLPLFVALAFGSPLVVGLVIHLTRLEFSSDLLAGISIVTSIFLGEYLAGTLVVLMLSGGQALEAYAVRRASYALEALARRLPSVANRKKNGGFDEIPLADVQVGDDLVVFPYDTCPVDGVVIDGRSTMNESYLTGEPYLLPKAPGSEKGP